MNEIYTWKLSEKKIEFIRLKLNIFENFNVAAENEMLHLLNHNKR